MKSQKMNKKFALNLAFFALCALMMESANALDLFDHIARISGKLPVVKVIVIYVAFIVGICVLVWGLMEMVKISKPENRGEATWTGILIKCCAGGALIGLTFFSDTMQQTLFNSTQSAPSNVSMFIEPMTLDVSKLG